MRTLRQWGTVCILFFEMLAALAELGFINVKVWFRTWRKIIAFARRAAVVEFEDRMKADADARAARVAWQAFNLERIDRLKHPEKYRGKE